MRRALLIGIASLLAVALIPPAAQAATQVRQVQVRMTDNLSHAIPPPLLPPGTLTLDFVFKNTRSNKRRFTPRQLIKIDFSKVPLFCLNTPSQYASQLQFTATFETKIELRKIQVRHPKPGRYAFLTVPYSFSTFNGTISVALWKENDAPKPRPVESAGLLSILDLDADPGHSNCTNVAGEWGGVPVASV
jgi:hypothetical protein